MIYWFYRPLYAFFQNWCNFSKNVSKGVERFRHPHHKHSDFLSQTWHGDRLRTRKHSNAKQSVTLSITSCMWEITLENSRSCDQVSLEMALLCFACKRWGRISHWLILLTTATQAGDLNAAQNIFNESFTELLTCKNWHQYSTNGQDRSAKSNRHIPKAVSSASDFWPWYRIPRPRSKTFVIYQEWGAKTRLGRACVQVRNRQRSPTTVKNRSEEMDDPKVPQIATALLTKGVQYHEAETTPFLWPMQRQSCRSPEIYLQSRNKETKQDID